MTRQTNKTEVIIIDSSVGVRHLDNTRSEPTSLEALQSGLTALDWMLNALRDDDIADITYIGGYHIQKVIQKYPDLQYRFHAKWREQGELAGLLLARPDRSNNVLILRAGTICVPKAIASVANDVHEITIGHYRDADVDAFAGLIMVPAERSALFFATVANLVAQNVDADIETCVEDLRTRSVPVQCVQVDGHAAPLHDRHAVARTVFGGKGRTLEQIRPLIQNAVVLDQVRFRAKAWRDNPGPIISKIQQTLSNDRLVVRSNTFGEDGINESAAGAFHSVLGVFRDNNEEVFAAVEEVIQSYTHGTRDIHPRDEVLVQPEVSNLQSSGVMLTRDMETGAPYRVINIDRTSGRSDTVTSGTEAKLETFYVLQNASAGSMPTEIERCTAIADELERLTHMDALDIEFGFDHQGSAYLFQVRPIAARARKFELADESLTDEVENIRQFLTTHFAPHPTIHGDRTLFGTMPDWNPAEMIGTAPRPLALSLYQTLIGNDAWAVARKRIGYRDCRPEPLIISLAGRPYVDVRSSLNSFLPSDLPHDVGQRWVAFNLDLLAENPELHDKIEFEVASTCLTFDFEADRQRMTTAGLDDDQIAEFRRQLLRLTDDVISGRVASIDSQVSELNILNEKRQRALACDNSSRSSLGRRINTLLRDCERHGTGPFSVLARYGFIAVSFMRSLKSLGVFSNDEYEAVLGEIPTVASDLSRDISALQNESMVEEDFVIRYGHLRPSSYDIESPNYANALASYLSGASASNSTASFPNVHIAEEIFDSKAEQITVELSKSGFSATAQDLRDFVLRAIPGREWAKFEFTKSLNAALESIAQFGESLGLSREDMSYLPVQTVSCHASESESGAIRTQFRRAIEFNQKRWNLTSAIRLPHLVCRTEDVEAFQLEQWQPNFITTKRVAGETVVLDDVGTDDSLDDRIVMIRAADPGYDWIFGHRIAGLITQYGGVASHMAIRAAEFGLPAAIGCGEAIFERLRKAKWIDLDCASKTIRGNDDHCGLNTSDGRDQLRRTA